MSGDIGRTRALAKKRRRSVQTTARKVLAPAGRPDARKKIRRDIAHDAERGFDGTESSAKLKESTMIMKKLFFCAIFILPLSSIAFAQEFEIKKYDINARVVPEEQKVDLQAKLRMVNLSDPDLGERILLSPESKPRMSFFLTPKAKVEAMKVNGAAVQFKTA